VVAAEFVAAAEVGVLKQVSEVILWIELRLTIRRGT